MSVRCVWAGVVLLVAVFVAACEGLSCSGESVSTTSSVATTGRTTTTTIATTTTTSTTTASTTTTTLSPLEAYKVEMRAWKNKYAADLEASYDVITNMGNPLDPSAEEIQAAKDLDDSMGEMVDDLKEIQPPPELSSAHADYLTSLKGMNEGVHDMAEGLDQGKAWRYVGGVAKVAKAWEEGTPARNTLERALGFSVSAAD